MKVANKPTCRAVLGCLEPIVGTCKVSEPGPVARARADRPNMARRAPVKRDVFFLWTTRGEFMRYLATTSDVLHRN